MYHSNNELEIINYYTMPLHKLMFSFGVSSEQLIFKQYNHKLCHIKVIAVSHVIKKFYQLMFRLEVYHYDLCGSARSLQGI